MIELTPDKFLTQILYRNKEEIIVLGFIAEYAGQGVAKRYKKSHPNYMYKDYVHNYKFSVDGVKWSRRWETYSGAIRELLKKHGKTGVREDSHVIPTPQTFRTDWYETEKDKT